MTKLTMEDLKTIDIPIIDLMENINKLGLETTFSCCGFDYEGQTDDKDHSLWPYFSIKDLDTKEFSYEHFYHLIQFALKNGWSVEKGALSGWVFTYVPLEEETEESYNEFIEKYSKEQISHIYFTGIFSLNKDIQNYLNNMFVRSAKCKPHKRKEKNVSTETESN